MYGRTSSLKSMYMLDNKEVQAYLKQALKGQVKDKTTGQKIDASKWKKAFNSKGAVDNKQQYFELLMSYIENETNYKGLNNKLMNTLLGKIDRLQGNWETLKADILGIDANDTGMVKKDKPTVIGALEDALDELDKWLAQSNTKEMLSNLGAGLASAVKSVSGAFTDFIKIVNWTSVGEKLKQIGESIGKVITKLTSSPQFMEFINNLPNIIEKLLNNKFIDLTTELKYAVDMANGDYLAAAGDVVNGKVAKWSNLLSGNEDTRGNSSSSTYEVQGMLTDTNASAVLADNAKLTNSQRDQISNMIKGDSQTVYNVSIGEIKADSFEQIVASLKKAQNNKTN